MSTTMTTVARPVGLDSVVSSEWTKFRSVRSTPTLAVVLTAVYPLFALLVAATGSLQPDDTILGASLLGGAMAAQVLAAALGAHLITNEFRTGSMQSTLLACPRRLTVLAAKAAIVAGVVAAATLIGGFAAFGIGMAVLDGDTYASGELVPAMFGVVGAMASIAVLGMAIGTMVRHPAGAVATVVGVVLLPGLLAPLLGGAERWVGGASLNGVLQKLVQSSDATPETVGSLGAWPSLLVVAGYTTAAVTLALWSLRRRDL
jgi:ABC-2 type transport system permease protein